MSACASHLGQAVVSSLGLRVTLLAVTTPGRVDTRRSSLSGERHTAAVISISFAVHPGG